MATLVMVRHGQSQWNLENRFTGWVDVALTEKGIEEAKATGELLKSRGYQFEIAFTSDLKRAQNTLSIILEILGKADLPIEKNQALNERHYGDLQGLNKAETAEKYGAEQVHIWRRSYDVAPPNGESLKDTAARTVPYFTAEIVPHLQKGENVLIAAHGNSLRALVMHIEKLTPDEILKREIATGQPIIYQFNEEMKLISAEVI